MRNLYTFFFALAFGLGTGCSGTDFGSTGSTKPASKKTKGAGDDDDNSTPKEQKSGTAPDGDPSSQDSKDDKASSTIACAGAKEQPLLKPGESTTLTWIVPATLKGDITFGTVDEGSVAGSGGYTATYTAPATISAGAIIEVRGKVDSATAICKVRLITGRDAFVADDGVTKGLVGNVYQLPTGTGKLPDLSAMKPLATVVAPNLDVPKRHFDQGFPGVPNLVEWFAIQFKGTITIPADGSYQFRLNSDDGSNLYLDGTKVVDDDGIHGTQARDGSATLTKGKHAYRVDYYQGPADEIALQVFWQPPGATMAIVPASVLGR